MATMMKKAIIVGASSGIGKELARILAFNNYMVGITGRREELLKELAQEKPDNFRIGTFDVRETSRIPDHLSDLVDKIGGLDLLIICAGTGDINNDLDFIIEKRTIDTNVSGYTVVADWSFNYFKDQKHGHLVGISSIGGLRGSGEAPAYNATKAYQINYLEGLRQRSNKLKDIHISDIRPGLVDTDMAKGEGLFWVQPVDKTANQIWRSIKKKKRIAYVTKRWILFAILLKWMPGKIYEKL